MSQRPSSAEDEDCAICYQKAVYPARLQCCRNCFCFLCIKGVFCRNGTCPLCRAPLPPQLFRHPSFSQAITNTVPLSDSQREELEDDDVLSATQPIKHEEDDEEAPAGDRPGPSTVSIQDVDDNSSQVPDDMKPTQDELAALLSLPSGSGSTQAPQEATQALLPSQVKTETIESALNALVSSQSPVPSSDLPDVKPDISSLLTQNSSQKPSTSENNSSQAPNADSTRSGAQWFYRGRRDGWWRYDPHNERRLERAYNDRDTDAYRISISGFDYEIEFDTMQQVRVDLTHCIREVRRVLPEDVFRFRRDHYVKGIAGIFYGGRNDGN